MTVYSGTLQTQFIKHRSKTVSKKKETVSLPRTKLFWANAMLAILVLVLFAGQIFISNSLVSQKVAVAGKKSELHAMSSKIASLESTITRGQDISNLVSLANRNGMIVGKDGDTLLISSHVAISNAQASKKQNN